MNAPIRHTQQDGPRPGAQAAAQALQEAGEALCRAARLLGLTGGQGEPSRPRPSPNERHEVPDRLSGKQLGAIRAASRRAGLSRDRLAALLEQLTGKVEPASLTRADASIVLDKLSAMTGYSG